MITVITKCFIFNVAAVLDPSLNVTGRCDRKSKKSDNETSRSESKYLKNKTEMNLKSYKKERNFFRRL